MEVFNDDVVGIYRRLNRYIDELQKSQSANVSEFNEFDVARMKSYLADITSFLDWMMSRPLLDMPETHPKKIELESPPALQEVENLIVRDFVRLFERGRDEITASQSARNASRLLKFDEERIRSIVEKAGSYLTDYVEKNEPLDLPESSPKFPDSGAGRGGINPGGGQ